METGTSVRCRQSGAALLLMMLVVIVAAATILVTKLSRHSGNSTEAVATQTVLATAKNALLDFAVTHPDLVPGAALQLPCPDIDDSGGMPEGESHTLDCAEPGQTVIGRLPWRTLGIPALKDAAGECLWYVVSGEYKSAAATTSSMINADTNGQLQLFQLESALMIEGTTPDTRPVAMIIAPQKAMRGQSRQAVSQPEQQCSDDFLIASFLDSDTGSGISNAIVNPGIGLDQFVKSVGQNAEMNDRILTISRGELSDLTYNRHDFQVRIDLLTQALAKCVAAYGLSNPGGPDDRRLPWPASTSLGDYREDSEYDDVVGGILSGRLADAVDGSNAETGNPVDRLITDCSQDVVPEWDVELFGLWRNWKDHFFYYVAESFSPDSAAPNVCTDCITVNGSGQYAAVILFANRRLTAIGQIRNGPPLDVDTKVQVSNYLESANASSHPYTSGTTDLQSGSADASFNDILYCIDPLLTVAAC